MQDQPRFEEDQMDKEESTESMDDGSDILPEWSMNWWLTKTTSFEEVMCCV
jgi:hypothetical protein